jgi:hypothetical protein
MTRFYAAVCIAGFGIVLAYAVWAYGAGATVAAVTGLAL